MANGGKVKGTQMIENFSWLMQWEHFMADVILFPLVGCDLILGMKWFITLGAITWDNLNLTMEFIREGHKVKLTACKEGKNQLPNDDKIQHQMREL